MRIILEKSRRYGLFLLFCSQISQFSSILFANFAVFVRRVRSFCSQIRSFYSQISQILFANFAVYYVNFAVFIRRVRSFRSQFYSFHSQIRSFRLQIRSFVLCFLLKGSCDRTKAKFKCAKSIHFSDFSQRFLRRWISVSCQRFFS